MPNPVQFRLQLGEATGYACIFLMPAFLSLGTWFNRPWLAIGFAFIVFPLLRAVFGSYRYAESILWDEEVATVLHALPLIYAIVAILSIGAVIAHTAIHNNVYGWDLTGLGLSLWVTILFGLCPAHELLHRRTRLERTVGAILSGAIGYPALALEHLPHHGRSGDTELAEWPRSEESSWAFTGRRLARVARELCSHLSDAVRLPSLHASGGDILLACSVTLATIGAFYMEGGWVGAAIYVVAAIGCAVGMQIITYLQHWGLADSTFIKNRKQPLAWEEDCRFQAWVTMHISFHQAHHLHPNVPFYRLGLVKGSPRLPSGYIVMMLICLIPSLWRRIMVPVLSRWRDDPNEMSSPGRRLTCFSRYTKRTSGTN